MGLNGCSIFPFLFRILVCKLLVICFLGFAIKKTVFGKDVGSRFQFGELLLFFVCVGSPMFAHSHSHRPHSLAISTHPGQ